MFDPDAYKQSTRAQWQETAEAWHRWPTLERWLGPATELMLDQAGVVPGARVLDLAAGAGGQSIGAAKRVGTSGSVLATDISPAILEYAAAAARGAGLANMEVREPDGEALDDLDACSFDAVISRVGLIYFPSRPETGNVLISIPAFATVNPVGSIVAHVSQHITAVTHAYESRIFNPPATES